MSLLWSSFYLFLFFSFCKDLTKLQGNWQRVIEFRNREVQEDDADTQEVLEDFLTRALTREYLDLLKVGLVGGSLTPEPSSDTMETEQLSNSPTPPLTRSNLAAEVISDLGKVDNKMTDVS